MKKCPLCQGTIKNGICTQCNYAPPDEKTLSATYSYEPEQIRQNPVREAFPEYDSREIYPNIEVRSSPQRNGRDARNHQGYVQPEVQPQTAYNSKYCKFCAAKIPYDAVVCTHCGRQVEALAGAANAAPVVIHNNNNNNNANYYNPPPQYMGRKKDKWVAFFLCLFLGAAGVHRFYEGKIGSGLFWLFTGGCFGIGWIIDLIILLTKPNPYYV